MNDQDQKLIKTYEETEKIAPYLALALVDTNEGLEYFNLPTYSALGLFYKNRTLYPLMSKDDSYKVSNTLAKNFLENPSFVPEASNKIEEFILKVQELIQKIERKNIEGFSNKQLLSLMHDLQGRLKELWGYVWLFLATDFPRENLTPKLKRSLFKEGLNESEITNLFSNFQQPNLGELELGQYYSELRALDTVDKNTVKKLNSDYYWIHWVYDTGKELTVDLVKEDKENAEELSNSNQPDVENHNLPKKVKRKIKHLQKMAQRKAEAKELVSKASYHASKMFSAASKRVNTSADKLRYLLFREIKQVFTGDKEINDFDIPDRMEKSVYLIQDSDIEVTTDKRVINDLNVVDTKDNTNKLQGNPVYNGQVTGKVCVIKGTQEAKQKDFPENAILVSVNTSPEMMSIMKKAKAIVTDIGGITSHAAIVSRELEVPCVIGTQKATQVLNDDDKIEVDADEGVVKILEKSQGQ